MNQLDWAILAATALLVALGIWKGLIRLVFAVLSVVVAVFVGGRATGIGTGLVGRVVENPAVAAVAAYLVLFVAVLLLMSLVGWMVSKAVHLVGLGWLDHTGGALLGLVIALLLTGVLFLAVDLSGYGGHPAVKQARLAPVGRWVEGVMDGAFPDEVRDLLRDRGPAVDRLKKRIEDGREKTKGITWDVRDRLPQEV